MMRLIPLVSLRYVSLMHVGKNSPGPIPGDGRARRSRHLCAGGPAPRGGTPGPYPRTHQAVRRNPRAGRGRPRYSRRRDPRSPRSQRCREVHPHQGARRRSPRRRRADHGGRAPARQPCRHPRHVVHPPGPRSRGVDDGRREHRPERRVSAPCRTDLLAADPRALHRGATGRRRTSRPRHADRPARPRRAFAGRPRPGPGACREFPALRADHGKLPTDPGGTGEIPRPRRADRPPPGRGLRPALPRPVLPARPGTRHPLRHPPPGRGVRGRRRLRRAARRPPRQPRPAGGPPLCPSCVRHRR